MKKNTTKVAQQASVPLNCKPIHIRDLASSCIDAGLSVIPVRLDGSKAPDGAVLPKDSAGRLSWKQYQTTPATEQELDRWFSKSGSGIGIVCGAVSGNLEVIDFDNHEVYHEYLTLAAQDDYLKALTDRVTKVDTPGGAHWYYRCDEGVEGNQKLAECAREEAAVKQTLIETRGEGGYVIAADNPASVHPSGTDYRFAQGDYDSIPTINGDERALLLNLARSLNRKIDIDTRGQELQKNEDPDAPGNAYNERGDWATLLTSHGWTLLYESGSTQYWQRPGKSCGRGVSATLNHAGSDRLYVFSSNAAPFESSRSYSKFQAYTFLEHDGDFKNAASQLTKDGYGKAVDEVDEKTSKSDKFVAVLTDLCLFHDDEDEPYADVPQGKGKRAYAISSQSFRQYLQFRYWQEYGRGANDGVLDLAINQLAAKAKFEGPQKQVFVRVGGTSREVYIDLCDTDRTVVKIDADGWRITQDCPVSFVQPKTALSLPLPIDGGNIDELWSVVNPKLSASDKVMVIGFILGCLHPRGPYAHLVIEGPPGSAKTTQTKILKRLLDPTKAAMRSLPGSDEDLALCALNARVLAFDNIDSLTPSMSDAFCRLSTGGGIGRRKHYSQDEEAVIEVQRPVIFNGINKLAGRPDLLSRAIVLNLQELDDEQRETEDAIMRRLDEMTPRLLGAFYSAVSMAIKNLSATRLKNAPRLADFATWVTAASSALGWAPDSFVSHFSGNQLQGVQSGLEQDPLAVAIISRMRDGGTVEMTASEWLRVLAEEAAVKDFGPNALPKANRLAGELSMIKGALKKAAGICISNRRSQRGMLYKIEKTACQA